MPSPYWNRISTLLADRRMSDAEFARAMKITYQAMKKVRDGGKFGVENNKKAADLLGVSSDWLATGEGPRNLPALTPPPAPASAQGPFEALTAEEMAFITDYRALTDPEREHYRREIHGRADTLREYVAKLTGIKAK